MVRIENPVSGRPDAIGYEDAEGMIAKGAAVAVIRVNGQIAMIRLTGLMRGPRELSVRGYDEVQRSFHREAARLPLVNPDKMIREEKSERKWSFSAGVEHSRKRIPMPRVTGVNLQSRIISRTVSC